MEHFWAIPFLWTEMTWTTLEPKDDPFSKHFSHEEWCFNLKGYLWHASLPEVDESWERKKKKKEKLIVMSCTWKIRLSPNENQESQIQKKIEKNEKTAVDAPFCSSYLFCFNACWTLDPSMSRFEFGPRTLFVCLVYLFYWVFKSFCV